MIAGKRTENDLWAVPVKHRAPLSDDMLYKNCGYGARINNVVNRVLKLYKTKAEMIEYMSTALFSQVKSTLIKTIIKIISISRLDFITYF